MSNPIFEALGGIAPTDLRDHSQYRVTIEIDGIIKFQGKLADPEKSTYEGYYRCNPNGQQYGPCIAIVGKASPERALRALAQAMCNFSPPATGPKKGEVDKKLELLRAKATVLLHRTQKERA